MFSPSSTRSRSFRASVDRPTRECHERRAPSPPLPLAGIVISWLSSVQFLEAHRCRSDFLERFRWKGICFSARDVRLEKDTFGPVLRAARERQGLDAEQLAAETKLSVELWEALEENDLSRWPKRVFARSYVRDYALRVGLDADEVVNDSAGCSPSGAIAAPSVSSARRPRSSRTISTGKTCRRRRAPGAATARPARRRDSSGRHRVRILGVAIDPAVDAWGWDASACMLGFNYWPSTAMGRLAYSRRRPTFFTGRSFGLVASDWLVRMLEAMPATRRLVSSRAESA